MSFGYQPGTADFMACLQRESLARRYSSYDWYYGPGWYPYYPGAYGSFIYYGGYGGWHGHGGPPPRTHPPPAPPPASAGRPPSGGPAGPSQPRGFLGNVQRQQQQQQH